MTWDQEFEYHLLLRLTKHHGVISVTREGVRLLGLARAAKTVLKEQGVDSAQEAAYRAIDELLSENGSAGDSSLRLTLKSDLFDSLP